MCASLDVCASLPHLHCWPQRPAPQDLATLPNGPAAFLLLDADNVPIQLGTTQALRRQLLARLTTPHEQRKGKADVAEIARGVRWRPLATAFEGRWWYYQLARALYPGQYRRLISFGPAWFLHVDWAAALPEISITERIWCLPGEFVGPWPTHAAGQDALTGLLDLFDLCRHPEQLRKSPHGTRCAYADMGRCDAPCDGSAPLAPYVQRCQAAWQFACGQAAAWTAAAHERMNTAARAQHYEVAGLLKKQLAFAARWQSAWGPSLRTNADWHFVLMLPATRRKAWKLLRFRDGAVDDGPVVPARRLGPEAGEWVRKRICDTGTARSELEPRVRMEQTWLVARLLLNADREPHVLVPLTGATCPADIEQVLVARVLALRQALAVAHHPADGVCGSDGHTPAENQNEPAKSEDFI